MSSPNGSQRIATHFSAEASYWNATYTAADVVSVVYQERLARTLAWVDALRLPADSRVLEVGVGAGLAAIALARRGLRVVAMDTVPAMVDLARRNIRAAELSGRATVLKGDVHTLQVRSESVQLALALGVVPWLHTPRQAVAELARVLVPGGFLLVSAANRDRLTYRLDPLHNQELQVIKRPIRRALERSGRWPVQSAPEPLLHTPAGSERLLSEAGLRVVDSATFGFGRFTLLGRPLLPEGLGVLTHRQLQAWADRGVRGLVGSGTEYLALARKPAQPGEPRLGWRSV